MEFTGTARKYRRDGCDRNARSAGQSRYDGSTRAGRSDGIDRRNWSDGRNRIHGFDWTNWSAGRDGSARSAGFVPGNLFDFAYLRGW